MKIGDLVGYYDSIESEYVYGLVIRKTKGDYNGFDVFWFDDFGMSANEREGLHGIKIFSRS